MRQLKSWLAAAFIIQLILSGCTKPSTPPPDLPQHGIVAYGDSREHHNQHRKLVQAIIQTEPSVVIHTGDFVTHSERAKEWDTALEIMQPLRDRALFLPARGNHEKDAAQFAKIFNLSGGKSWYSADYDSVHYLIIDSERDQWQDSTQYKWILQDLQSIPESALLTVAIFHIPVFTSGKWGPSGYLRKRLTPLFVEYGVDLVLNGHNHSYERLEKDGITYIVSGGGGASLYEQSDNRDEECIKFYKGIHFCVFERIGKRLSGRVYTPKFEEIDRFTIEG